MVAPHGRGSGGRGARLFEGSLVCPKKRTAHQSAFANLETFLMRSVEGDPGAIELGLELTCRLELEAAVPIAERLLAQGPWTGLGMAIGRALGACASERSFVLLLEHSEVPYLRDRGRQEQLCERGGARVVGLPNLRGRRTVGSSAHHRMQVLPLL